MASGVRSLQRSQGVAERPASPSFLALWRAAPPSVNDNRRETSLEEAPELACLRGVLADDILSAAAARAARLGVGADQALIAAGVIAQDAYVARLARHLHLATDDLARVDLAASPLQTADWLRAAEFGILPLRRRNDLVWAIAPRRLGARRLSRLVAAHPELRERIVLTDQASLDACVLTQARATWASEAAFGLARRFPDLCAASPRPRPRWLGRLQRAAASAALVVAPPLLWPELAGALLAGWFLGFVAFRIGCCLMPRDERRPPASQDERLPDYSIIVALYREAASVGPLLAALDRLDYPREKLDILIVVEPDDLATRAALARLRPRRSHCRVVIAPEAGPKTKPKALNAALPLARGRYVAVYDAEDRPEPDQLRKAVAAFEGGGDDLACVQGRLAIDNLEQSWLSRLFTAEYAGQFDLFLPGLAALRLPLPLGGSSNHFRADALRIVGGWDAHNVTEDADLGFRLARFGYRSATIESTTFEEAPVAFGPWLRQRTRWMKGWIQTWCVHMRRPLRAAREAGPLSLMALNLIVGGNVLTALAHPWMLYIAARDLLVPLATGAPLQGPAPLHAAAVIAGYAATAAIGVWGLWKRRRLRLGLALLLTPLYWTCLSVAAWRALAQFIVNPSRWEKTEHGVVAREPTYTAFAAARPAVRPENRQPPRKVPSSER